jgi:hypothetical protein
VTCVISKLTSVALRELTNVNEASKKSSCWRQYVEKYTVCGFRIITMIIHVGCQFIFGLKYVIGMYIPEVLIKDLNYKLQHGTASALSELKDRNFRTTSLWDHFPKIIC